jgi:peptidoglycan/xylan/chitin deacetylase (PgdA/CDA1 family)
MSIRKIILGALTAPGVAALWHPLTRGATVVFMLHRFEDPDRGVQGLAPGTLRDILAFLHRRRYRFVGLHDVIRSLRGDMPPLHRGVAFTIDDGYREHATVAGPAFAEFDCPVTTFVTSGFLDGALWFWWDQIEYVFANAQPSSISLELGAGRLVYDLTHPGERERAQLDFTARCKAISDDDKHVAIRGLAAAAEVYLPPTPPPQYTPMSWEELRAAETRGMTFGPHTVTHPILSRTDDARSQEEIARSWDRLTSEARAPVPIFAYPNGQLEDFGPREIRIIREVGLEGACVGEPGYATAARYRAPDGAYRIPRYAFPSTPEYVAQFASGLERAKRLLRGQD